MAVITISREYGSGGDELASRLCEVLGYHAFGKTQITQAAEETNLSKLNAIDYTEDNHEVQSFLDRLLGQTASPVQRIAWSLDPSIATRPERADVKDAAVLSLVKRAVKAALHTGDFVILGRGGQVLLNDAPGVLHVRVEAPIEDRLQRVMTYLRNEPGVSVAKEDELLRTAGDRLANRDVASADYIKRYFNADWADPHLYHLILNLGRLTVEQAVQIVVAAVQAIEANQAVAK